MITNVRKIGKFVKANAFKNKAVPKINPEANL
jgi:hypothetical protein